MKERTTTAPPGLGRVVAGARRRLSAAGVEVWTLVAVLLVTTAVWGIVALTEEVVEGDTQSFDRTVLLALRSAQDPEDPLGPLWLEEMMRDFTALGGVGVLTLATLATIGYLALERHWRLVATVAVLVGGGVLLSSVFKAVVDRPRPDLVTHGSHVVTASFPSGHSMMAATVYLTLAALLLRDRPRRIARSYILAVAMLVTMLVGVSRVYLGVHWPTDVFAGWAVGAAWALFAWTTAGWVMRRRERAGAAGVTKGR